MLSLGVDIGSATSKLVAVADNVIQFKFIMPTYPDPKMTISEIEKKTRQNGTEVKNVGAIIATGYGRMQVPFATGIVTEISCHARGAHWLFPSVRTIIDIGGQDSKVIRLDDEGRVRDFQMNDKCAAGTGRFLDHMARVLQVKLEALGELSLSARKKAVISSICTVFAESEVVSQIAQGTPREEIIAGLHQAITDRIYAMAGRVGVAQEVAMTGGVAKNRGVVKSLEQKLGLSVLVPDDPQITGALGAALIAAEAAEKKH